MEQKVHFKLHKVKKAWIIIGISGGAMLGAGASMITPSSSRYTLFN